MKQSTKRLIAAIASLVIVADSIAMPMCSKPVFRATLVEKQVIIKPLQPFTPIQTPQPIQPKPQAEAKKIEEPKPLTMTFRVTAYTAIDQGQDGKGITASGKKAVPYRTVAASKDYPFGTILVDVNTGAEYIVEDRGGAIYGNRLDLYIGHSNKGTAANFGVQYRQFKVIKKGEK